MLGQSCRAWTTVAVCFMTMVCTRAVTRCMGLYFLPLQEEFHAGLKAVALIQSLQDGLTMLCAPLSRCVTKQWSSPMAAMLGGALVFLGFLLSCFSTSLDLLYLTMGVLPGLGFALCYTAVVGTVGDHFPRTQRYHSLAYGLALSGNGIGTSVLAPLTQQLRDRWSWRWGLGLTSISGTLLMACGALLQIIRPQQKEAGPAEGAGPAEEAEPGKVPLQDPAPPLRWWRRIRSSPESRLLQRTVFQGLVLSFLFLAFGCNLPFAYVVPFAQSVAARHSASSFNASILMTVLGAMEIVGNISFGWLTDCSRCLRSRRVACYGVVVALMGVCCLSAPLLTSSSLLVVFAVFFGYLSGVYNALLPVVTVELVGDENQSSALGLVYFAHGVPYLASSPIGGWLVDITGSYNATFLFCGAVSLVSAAVLAVVAGIQRQRGGDGAVTEHTPPKPLPHALPDQSDASQREQALAQDNPGFTLEEVTAL